MQKISVFHGLSKIEAASRFKKDGPNELPSQKEKNSLNILFKVLSEPMLLLLVGAAAIYLFLGEFRDAFLLFLSVLVVIGITFFQERKTERTLAALRELSSPRALVIRGGQQERIAGREVVRGDVFILREGDRIPADAFILACENLSVDESLLTGESIPVRKIESGRDEQQPDLEITRPGGEESAFVYSGSLVVSGRGIAKVISIGANTEIGRIGRSLASIKKEKTLLRRETGKIVQLFAVIGFSLCAAVVLFYALVRNNFLEGILAGITLGMAVMPEEFPVVLTVFMALGAWRISKNKVLPRRSEAIETLGAATVLCTDKTGTLTLNKMELSSLYADGSFYEISDFASTDLPEKFKVLLEHGVLASQNDRFDPIEKELNKMGGLYLPDFEKNYADWDLIREYPLSDKLLALSHVWQSATSKRTLIAAKGAPEAIISLCHVDSEKKREILQRIAAMAEKGLRVLGVARAVFNKEVLPADQHDYEFKFLGLLGFVDPVRSTAAGAIKEAYEAGMRVIMITGDYPGTARFIAKKLGIKNPDACLTGAELNKLEHLELREKIKTINIFARVAPEQKLLLVNALKANNEVVAMTGDGVNDAPALQSAHIGVAMGKRGTDVAREASALVLLDDDFSSIVTSVRLGRRIYDNLKRAMGYIVAVHIPTVGMSILPLLFNLPIVLFPAHIAFLELIIDPACSTVFEAEKEDRNIMKKPPRGLHQSIFTSRLIWVSLFQGLSALVAALALFFYALKTGHNEPEARSFAFSALVLSNISLIIINLSWKKSLYKIILAANPIAFIISGGALFCLLAVLYIPFLASLFHLAPLSLFDFILIVIVSGLSLSWFEILKKFKNKAVKFKAV